MNRRSVRKLGEGRRGIRDRQREVALEAVMEVACDLFLAKGYQQTTTGQIADAAGIGVATFFRYFKSKEGVLAAISRRNVFAVLQRAREVLEHPPQNPAEGVLEMCLRTLEIHTASSARISGSTRLWLMFPTGHKEIDQVGRETDIEFQQMLLDLLKYYRRAGLLDPRLDLDDLVMTIFSVFYQHYVTVGLDRTVTLESVREQLRRRIPLLFVRWMTDGARASGARRNRAAAQ